MRMKDDVYTCAECGGVYTKETTDEEANAEAEAIFGVKGASHSSDMAIICDDCYNAMAKRYGWKVPG